MDSNARQAKFRGPLVWPRTQPAIAGKAAKTLSQRIEYRIRFANSLLTCRLTPPTLSLINHELRRPVLLVHNSQRLSEIQAWHPEAPRNRSGAPLMAASL